MTISRKRTSFKNELLLSLGWMAFLILVETVNASLDHGLNIYGIDPRNTGSLPGIYLTPVLHSSRYHLFSNLLPLGVFMLLVMQHGIARFWLATVFIITLGGALVWLLGRPAIHVGASGLVFGYFSFLIIAGIRSRDLKLLLIAIAVGFFYGGIIWGVIPRTGPVSWEAHLFGLFAGLIAGYLLGPRRI